MTRRRGVARGFGIAVLAVLGIAAGWGTYDLFAPRSSSLRSFDPAVVARLETAMWRSYYEHDRGKLFLELTELLRDQYHLPPLRSNTVAYHAARAAVVFQRGRNRAEYDRALPDLLKYYAAILSVSDAPFDVDRVARLELEWWIVHRERGRHAPGDLDHALAALQAELFGIPEARVMEHARLRAEAMTIRDTRAANGGVREADWLAIENLLQESWGSLHAAVHTGS
jgi:hypothetical protein